MKSSDCIPREKTLRLPKEFSEKIFCGTVLPQIPVSFVRPVNLAVFAEDGNSETGNY